MRRRRLLALLLPLALLTPTTALAATTLGGTPVPTDGSCTVAQDVFQTARPGTGSAAMTGQGVITSWTFRAGAQPAAVALRVYRPQQGTDQVTVLSGSEPQQVAAGSGLVTFPTRQNLSTGDFVGLRSTTVVSGACLAQNGSSDFTYRVSVGGSGAVGSTATFASLTGAEVDVAVTIEPDRDQDGYGDETQDQCAKYGPTCPTPDTVLLAKPKKASSSKFSTFRFTATAAVSTYFCQLDRGPVKSCTSPQRYRCLDPGRHRFRVYALGTAANPDTTPVQTRFRVPHDRAGC